MLPQADRATPPGAMPDDAAAVGAFARQMLLDLAVSYALVLGPQLHLHPDAPALACPHCGMWGPR